MTSIDGKAIKGMTERVNDGKPRYFMNAQKSGGTISLASREVGEKKKRNLRTARIHLFPEHRKQCHNDRCDRNTAGSHRYDP